MFEENTKELEKLFVKLCSGISNVPIIFITNNHRNYLQLLETVDQITFLKINKTNMKKALVRLGANAASLSQTIESADGDIRAAINGMKFNSMYVCKFIKKSRILKIYLDAVC